MKIYNEKIKEDFIFEFNKKFKENFSDEDFILLIHKLTNGTMNVSNIIIERNKYINTNLTEGECENLTFKAKHMRLETNKTRAFINYLIELNPDYEIEILKTQNNIIELENKDNIGLDLS